MNPLSTTVVFEKPASQKLVRRWQLACQDDIAHVVVMPSADRSKLKHFFTEYMADRAAAGAASHVEQAKAAASEAIAAADAADAASADAASA